MVRPRPGPLPARQ